ncbi:MAG: MFS transporter [Candidatus Omnitrophica bacterium]|nr:MFS transporter [Candidatus Omnitrophota bacterium]
MSSYTTNNDQYENTRRKIAWRILPFVFGLYIVAYLDRANVSFAKLAMAKDLKFSEEVFGTGFGIFFIGYLFLEIPGALLVERWSARKWFARILVTWGICATLIALVRTPSQFYWARFLLGVAEAGFFPGIIVYFTHWFAGRDRARALSGLLVAVPFSLALGAPISALLLKANWLGLAGWQWMFILEGCPAMVLGIATFFYLPDHPRDARWLTAEERQCIENILEQEKKQKQKQKQAARRSALIQALREPNVWWLALGICATNIGGYAFLFWLPTTIQSLSGGSPSSAAAWTTLPYALGLLSVYWSGQSSDRTGERKWHCAGSMAMTAVFLAMSAIPGQSFAWVMFWLCLTGLAAYFWITPYWVLPTLTLTESAAAVTIGFINMCANLAGFIGSPVVGWLRDRGVANQICLLFLASCYLLGAVFISLVRVPPRISPSANLALAGPVAK